MSGLLRNVPYVNICLLFMIVYIVVLTHVLVLYSRGFLGGAFVSYILQFGFFGDWSFSFLM
ncbi:hypothetical protein V1519DRAFT_114651 [Lipomyces tetrasporus]